MSAVALVGLGLTLLVVPGVLRGVGRRVRPAPWTVLVATSFVGGFVVLELGVVLLALPTVLTAAGFPAFAEACARMLHLLDRFPAWISWAAAALAVAQPVVALRALFAARRAQRALAIEPWLGDHAVSGDHEIVVVPTDRPLAFSVFGRPPQVVLSEGLAGSLPSAQLRAVIGHEEAHLRHRHDRYLMLARTIEASVGVLPGVRAGVGSFRTGIERWADEAAAPTLEARSSVLAALIQVGHTILMAPVAQFGPPDTVAERLAALRRDPVTANGPLLFVGVPVAAFLGIALVSLVSWLGMARTMLAAFGYCPS